MKLDTRDPSTNWLVNRGVDRGWGWGGALQYLMWVGPIIKGPPQNLVTNIFLAGSHDGKVHDILTEDCRHRCKLDSMQIPLPYPNVTLAVVRWSCAGACTSGGG